MVARRTVAAAEAHSSRPYPMPSWHDVALPDEINRVNDRHLIITPQ